MNSRESSIFQELTDLPDELIAEILAFLSLDEKINSSAQGLRFFSQRSLVHQAQERAICDQLKEIFEIDWDLCDKTFGGSNLYPPLVAYENFGRCFEKPEFMQYDEKLLATLKHPLVPVCILQQLPTEVSQLKAVSIAFSQDPKAKKLDESIGKYGIRLACLCDNTPLLKSLVAFGKDAKYERMRPCKDDFQLAIISRSISVLKYILAANDDFGIILEACDKRQLEILLKQNDHQHQIDLKVMKC